MNLSDGRAGGGTAAASSRNPLGDDRFGAMFESEAFEIDPNSEEYARAHPTSLIANKMVSQASEFLFYLFYFLLLILSRVPRPSFGHVFGCRECGRET